MPDINVNKKRKKKEKVWDAIEVKEAKFTRMDTES